MARDESDGSCVVRTGVGRELISPADVFNGRDNHVSILITNHDKRSWELTGVNGQFKQIGGAERPLRNTTAQRYSLVLPPTSVQPMRVPYKVRARPC